MVVFSWLPRAVLIKTGATNQQKKLPYFVYLPRSVYGGIVVETNRLREAGHGWWGEMFTVSGWPGLVLFYFCLLRRVFGRGHCQVGGSSAR
jgi:hypothetical protein